MHIFCFYLLLYKARKRTRTSKLSGKKNSHNKKVLNLIIRIVTEKIYWNQSIITDYTTINNNPDLVLIDRNTKRGYAIDIAVPTDNTIDKIVSERVE